MAKKLSIVIISIIILFSAAALVYSQVPSVQNTVKLNTMKPTAYMLDIEENNAKTLNINLDNLTDMSEGYKINYAVSPAIAPDFNGTITADVYKQGVLTETLLSAELADEEINIDAIIDSSTMESYMTVPGVTDMWFKVANVSMSGIAGSTDYTKWLTPSNVEELTNRYSGIIFKYFTDVTVDKKTGVIEAKFEFNDIPDLAYEIGKTMQNDKLMEDILTDAGIWNDFDGAMNSLRVEDFRKAITETGFDLSEHIVIKTYVNKNGEVTKREVSYKEDYAVVDLVNKTAEVKFGVFKANFSEGNIVVAYESGGMTITDALTIQYEKTTASEKTISIPTQNVTEDITMFENSLDSEKLTLFEELGALIFSFGY
jgi:hypothetical protein